MLFLDSITFIFHWFPGNFWIIEDIGSAISREVAFKV